MPQRHRGPLPVPTPELVRLQGMLNPFESTLWEGGGHHIFVARVTAAEPDLVNDIESIVDLAAPTHVEQAEAALVLTPRNVHAIPMDPLRHLMADRVAFDARHAARLRQEIPTTAGVRLFRATDDPKRRLRLAIRIAQESVAHMDDDDLLDAAEALGSELERGLTDVHCVYLIAARDHVRLRPGDIVDELLEKWDDPARRERLAQERLQAQMEAEEARRAAKKQLDDELRARFSQKVAHAPVKRLDAPILEREDTITARPGVDFEDVRRRVDALEWRVSEASVAVQEMVPRPRDDSPAADPVDALQQRLQALGYATRLRPQVPGFQVAMAAERVAAPGRVLAFDSHHVTAAVARRVRQAATTLPVDCVLILSDKVDRAARKHLKGCARIIHPAEARDLTL